MIISQYITVVKWQRCDNRSKQNDEWQQWKKEHINGGDYEGSRRNSQKEKKNDQATCMYVLILILKIPNPHHETQYGIPKQPQEGICNLSPEQVVDCTALLETASANQIIPIDVPKTKSN